MAKTCDEVEGLGKDPGRFQLREGDKKEGPQMLKHHEHSGKASQAIQMNQTFFHMQFFRGFCS